MSIHAVSAFPTAWLIVFSTATNCCKLDNQLRRLLDPLVQRPHRLLDDPRGGVLVRLGVRQLDQRVGVGRVELHDLARRLALELFEKLDPFLVHWNILLKAQQSAAAHKRGRPQIPRGNPRPPSA